MTTESITNPAKTGIKSVPAKSYAAKSATGKLEDYTIQRREPTDNDVVIDILYCGVCHSDLHSVRNEWSEFMETQYPIVPGHEIAGRVTKVGKNVKKFKEGDLAAVGCMVDSCRNCDSCKQGLENYCTAGMTLTYNGPDKHLGGVTYGGYSESVVVDQNYVLRVSDKLDLAAVAPLLCAGITTFSPLHHWKVGKGQKVGIVGLGGLGHMGVKFAHAMGAHVVLITTSPSKAADAKRLGADEVIISTDKDDVMKHFGSFNFILDTVSAKHDINSLLGLLKLDGHLCMVGAPEKPLDVAAFALIMGRKSFTGSGIGGIKETQEMLDFCEKHNIVSDIELIPIDQINTAYERLQKSDVKYRFVIDMASLKK